LTFGIDATNIVEQEQSMKLELIQSENGWSVAEVEGDCATMVSEDMPKAEAQAFLERRRNRDIILAVLETVDRNPDECKEAADERGITINEYIAAGAAQRISDTPPR